MRGISFLSFLLSLFAHFLLLVCLTSWGFQVESRKNVEVEIPLNLSWEEVKETVKGKLREEKVKKNERKRKVKRLIKKKKVKVVRKKAVKKANVKTKVVEVKKQSLEKGRKNSRKNKSEINQGLKRKREKEDKGIKEQKVIKKEFKPSSPVNKIRTKEETSELFDKESYRKRIISVLNKNKFYPPLARRLGIEGRVKVKITIDRSGRPVEVKVLESEGGRVLEKAAIKLIKSSKFPPLPESFKGDRLNLVVEIGYRLVN